MKKKVIYMTAFFLVCIAVLIPHTNASAANKIKLNKTSVSIQKGKTRTLKLKGAKKKNVKWTSNKKKIATVKNGVVKAKKVGQCTITAKYKGKKYKCKVKVKEVTEPNVDGKITMTAKLSDTGESLKLVISNTTGKEYAMGMEFILEYYENGGWIVVESDVPVTSEAAVIPAGRTGSQTIVFGNFYDSLKKGLYRITKTIYDGPALSTEFTLDSDMVYSN